MSDLYIPATPKNVVIRPLDKGIINKGSPADIPMGGFLDMTNYRVSSRGLTRRGDWVEDNSFDDFAQFGPLQDMWIYWSTAGALQSIAVDRKFLYELTNSVTNTFSATVHSQVYSSTDDGSSIVVDGTAVTGTGTDFTVLEAGDVLYIGGASTGVEIASVADSTNMTLVSASTSASTSFDARYGLYTLETFTYETSTYSSRELGGNSYPDATIIDNKLVFVDSKRAPQVYDGSSVTDLGTGAPYIATCITTFRDRLVIGQIRGDSGSFLRQRIRWSNVAPNYDTFDAADYIDLPYTRGAVWRLVPFSNMLMAFFDDAVFFGRPTNSSDSPIYFEQMETGGIGLVGMRALTGWLDTLFFLGKNNVYQVTAEGAQGVGDNAIVKVLKSYSTVDTLRSAMMYTDTVNEKIGVLLPAVGSLPNMLWEMDMGTGAWSKLLHPAQLGFVKETALSYAITLGSVSGQIGDMKGRFGDYTSDIGTKRLYYGGSGDGDFGFLRTDKGDGYDLGVADLVISGRFTTGDLDLGVPNVRKMWTQFSMKVEEPRSTSEGDLSFRVEASVGRGTDWSTVGTLTIESGTDEGHVNFRRVGSLIRFRVTEIGGPNPSYTICEMVVRAKPRGKEWRYE